MSRLSTCALLGVFLLGCATGDGPARTSDVRPERPMIVNEPAEHFFVFAADSREAVVDRTEGEPNAFSGLWEFRFPPDITVSEAGVRRYVDALAGGNLTHFFINVNYQRAFYPSRVIEPVWTSLDEPDRQCQPFLRRMKEAFEGGLDVYATMIARCREKGVSPWLSFRMNDVHGTLTDSDPMASTFWKEHPEFRLLGETKSWENGFDYAHAEVRDRMTAFIREAVERYDVDGIELDFIRFPNYFRKGEEPAGAATLTGFVRGLRAVCDEASRRRGHPVKIVARLLPAPARAAGMGVAADAWAREGLVDAFVICNMYGSIEYDYHLEGWRTLVGDRVRLIAGTDNGIVEGGARRILNLDEYRHWIDVVSKAGADGVYFFNFPLRPFQDEAWRGILGSK